jgi:hypothetical protein
MILMSFDCYEIQLSNDIRIGQVFPDKLAQKHQKVSKHQTTVCFFNGKFMWFLETLFALINGSLSPLSAYINGSVVIKGSVSDVTSLKLLAARAKEFKIAQIV